MENKHTYSVIEQYFYTGTRVGESYYVGTVTTLHPVREGVVFVQDGRKYTYNGFMFVYTGKAVGMGNDLFVYEGSNKISLMHRFYPRLGSCRRDMDDKPTELTRSDVMAYWSKQIVACKNNEPSKVRYAHAAYKNKEKKMTKHFNGFERGDVGGYFAVSRRWDEDADDYVLELRAPRFDSDGEARKLTRDRHELENTLREECGEKEYLIVKFCDVMHLELNSKM